MFNFNVPKILIRLQTNKHIVSLSISFRVKRKVFFSLAQQKISLIGDVKTFSQKLGVKTHKNHNEQCYIIFQEFVGKIFWHSVTVRMFKKMKNLISSNLRLEAFCRLLKIFLITPKIQGFKFFIRKLLRFKKSHLFLSQRELKKN